MINSEKVLINHIPKVILPAHSYV